jgi:heat-inducible transcriptional repressor
VDDRKQTILCAVIEAFISGAEPVGSKRLVEEHELDISAATVRNELARLEEMGYLSQPHTSAGRVPTDKGYRYYVDHLGESPARAPSQVDEIRRFYAHLNHEIGQMMRETSHLLSRLTSCVALVYAPDISRARIKHIDLVALGGKGLMIVVITSTGLVSKQVIDHGGLLTGDLPLKMEKMLNESLVGLPADQVGAARLSTDGFTSQEAALAGSIRDCIVGGLTGGEAERVYFNGAAYLLDSRVSDNLSRARRVLGLLEQNYRLLEWFQVVADSAQVTISIGAENELDLEGYSLVASGYEMGGENAGALGILGPTRMDYGRAITAVRCIAESLSEVLSDLKGEPGSSERGQT